MRSKHSQPLVTRSNRPNSSARDWETLELIAFAFEDRAAASRDIDRQVDRINRGDCIPAEKWGWPAGREPVSLAAPAP